MQLYDSSQLVFLWVIPLLILLFAWGGTERRRRLNRIGNAQFIEHRLMPGFSPLRRKWSGGVLTAILFLSVVALARPQWGEEKKRVERKGVDLIFLLDTSLSMLAEDIKPNRLGKSKLAIKSFIRLLKGDRVGMVAFAGSSFLQCPLTMDYSAFLLFVDALKPGYIPDPGTSLSRAIDLGIRAFPEESRKYRAMILFSDGEHHEGNMKEALDAAKKAGVRIYAVGVGTPQGDPIPLRAVSEGKPVSGYKKDREGQVVITRLNPGLLTEIARETGGLYLPATAAEKEVDLILKHLETLGERKLRERLVVEREDHFQLFLFIAFLLLVGESLLGNRTRSVKSLVLPLLAFVLLSGLIDSPRSLVQKGNRLVEEKKYQSAVENYRKAEVAKPKDPVIRYNLGTAFYHLYEYRDAERELEQALPFAKEAPTQAKVLYNYGNTNYRLGNFDKAIEAYKKVLDLNPKDEDAKYNLEFLQKKKSEFEKKHEERQKEQKQQPKPQPQKEQKQPEPQPQPQPKQGESQPQAGPQTQEEEGEGKAQPRPEQGEEEEQKPHERGKEKPEERKEEKGEEEKRQGEVSPDKQPERPGDRKEPQQEQGPEGKQPLQGQMSQEDALRLLEALREGERELQDLRRPPLRPESREVLKDW